MKKTSNESLTQSSLESINRISIDSTSMKMSAKANFKASSTNRRRKPNNKPLSNKSNRIHEHHHENDHPAGFINQSTNSLDEKSSSTPPTTAATRKKKKVTFSTLHNDNDNDNDNINTNVSGGSNSPKTIGQSKKRSFKRGRTSDFHNDVKNVRNAATFNLDDEASTGNIARYTSKSSTTITKQYIERSSDSKLRSTASAKYSRRNRQRLSSIMMTEHHDSRATSKGVTNSKTSKPKRNVIIESREVKAKRSRESLKKRKNRMIDTKKRREQIEKERIVQRQVNSGSQRQQRWKMKAEEKRRNMNLVQNWTMLMILGSRIQSATSMVAKFRLYRMQLEREDKAAKIITRQMRNHKFRMYRKRVRGAIRVLSTVFLVKVRLWKNSRRGAASDKIRAFLLALERDNIESGGCLALIVKGKKWRAYRLKIIILQRLWREKLRIALAQVLLIDEQWKQEQHQRTETEIENIFVDEQRRISEENEHLDNVNRTRRIIKLKPLLKKIWRTKEEIRASMLKGKDLLSVGHIIPTEIRHELIRNVLTRLKRYFLYQTKLYESASEKFREEIRDRQRRRALLVKFSGNSWIWGRRSSQSKINEWEASHQLLPPVKPILHIVLNENALSALMAIGQRYIDDLRKMWNPKSMMIAKPTHDIHEVVEIHTRENLSIIENIKRNEYILSR